MTYASGSSPSIGGYPPLLRYQREARSEVPLRNYLPSPRSCPRRGIKNLLSALVRDCKRGLLQSAHSLDNKKLVICTRSGL